MGKSTQNRLYLALGIGYRLAENDTLVCVTQFFDFCPFLGSKSAVFRSGHGVQARGKRHTFCIMLVLQLRRYS